MNKKVREKLLDEYLAKLRADPDYIKAQEAKAQRQREHAIEYRKREASVMQHLAAAGYPADSFKSFVEQYAPLHLKTVEVLFIYLQDPEYKILVETIVRALAVARNRFDGQYLAQLYDAAWESESLRFAIQNTIALTHPYGIGAWLKKFKENEYHRKQLEGLGIDWTYYD